MIGIGIGLLLLSISAVLNPRAVCQDNLDTGFIDGERRVSDTYLPLCNDPSFYIENPTSNNFILTILSICLASFGAALLGIVIRLGK